MRGLGIWYIIHMQVFRFYPFFLLSKHFLGVRSVLLNSLLLCKILAFRSETDAAKKFKTIRAWWQDMVEQNKRSFSKADASSLFFPSEKDRNKEQRGNWDVTYCYFCLPDCNWVGAYLLLVGPLSSLLTDQFSIFKCLYFLFFISFISMNNEMFMLLLEN